MTTIELESTILAEIRESAKDWLDYQTSLYERLLKEKRWNFLNQREEQECSIIDEVCLGCIAHRIIETLYPEEYQKLQNIIAEVLSTVKIEKNSKQTI